MTHRLNVAAEVAMVEVVVLVLVPIVLVTVDAVVDSSLLIALLRWKSAMS